MKDFKKFVKSPTNFLFEKQDKPPVETYPVSNIMIETDTISKLEKKISEYQEHFNDYESTLAELTQKNDDLQNHYKKSIEEYETEVYQLKDELSQSKKEIERYKEQIVTLQMEIHEVKTENELKESTVRKLRNTINESISVIECMSEYTNQALTNLKIN
jgi:predicted  nucleic acid-binding Zn-ribbon protein